MFRRRHHVRGFKIRVLQEIATHIRGKEHDRTEKHQEDNDANQVFGCVVGMEGNSIEWHTFCIFLFLDIDAVGVV